MEWAPLLVGDDAERAAVAIRDIVSAMDSVNPATIGASTAAGYALMHAHVALAFNDSRSRERAAAWMSVARACAEAESASIALFESAITVAFVEEHCRRLLGIVVEDGIADEVDEALIELLSDDDTLLSFEVIAGLSGIGFYAAERRAHRSGQRLRDLVVARLNESATVMSVGRAWKSTVPESTEIAGDLVAVGDGLFATGMAHGASGVVAFLADALRDDGASVGTALQVDALRWIESQSFEHAGVPLFSITKNVNGSASISRARYSWCWGDLGIWAAILGSRARLDGPVLVDRIETACTSFAGSPGMFGPYYDACLCHGATGIGHIMNRLHHATGWPACATAARHWLRVALEMRDPRGAGGYLFALDRDGNLPRYGNSTRFLSGVTGVGLALVAAISAHEPDWDRLLGLGSLHTS